MDRLSSLTKDFNLKLVFAMKSGDYVSDVKVTIADTAGKTLLNTTSEGPWFLTKLPVGNYQIVATFAGNAEKRTVAVGAEKLVELSYPDLNAVYFTTSGAESNESSRATEASVRGFWKFYRELMHV